MPVMNKEAVRLTVISGMMIGSKISEYSKFDRKSYFYPDMPKNYQISQFDKPLCEGGAVPVTVDVTEKVIGVTRIHLEEDVGKNTHLAGSSGIDFNRAGHPLMEIVSEPDMNSPEEAYAYLQELRRILLSSIPGCAITEAQISGVLHEYTSIDSGKVTCNITNVNAVSTIQSIVNELGNSTKQIAAKLLFNGIPEAWSVDKIESLT